MLGWILLGLLCATTVVVINGIITKKRIGEAMGEQGIKEALIDSINRCSNTLTVKDLDSGKVLELQGDGVADELNECDRIYA